MSVRIRKLVGAVALVALIVVYCLVVMVFANTALPLAATGGWQFVFYALAGLAWVPPAAAIVWWMHQGA